MFIYKHMRKQGTLAETYTISAIYIAQVMNIKKNIVHPTAIQSQENQSNYTKQMLQDAQYD